MPAILQKLAFWALQKFALLFWDFVKAYTERKRQEKLDEKNAEEYRKAIEEKASLEERTKKGEDLLNGT